MRGQFFEDGDLLPNDWFTVESDGANAVLEGTITVQKPIVVHKQDDAIHMHGLVCGPTLHVDGFNHCTITFQPELIIYCPCQAPA